MDFWFNWGEGGSQTVLFSVVQEERNKIRKTDRHEDRR